MVKSISTSLEDFKIRFAEEEDVSLILDFIKELADYEKLLHEVSALEETLKDSLFRKKAAKVIIGEYKGMPVSFAVFFYNFSTFLGVPGLYLEDLYVKPEMRGKGFGTIILSFLAKLAKEEKCGRFEWSVLDWNDPSIRFYKSLGAIPLEDWTVYRVTGDSLDNLAEKF